MLAYGDQAATCPTWRFSSKWIGNRSPLRLYSRIGENGASRRQTLEVPRPIQISTQIAAPIILTMPLLRFQPSDPLPIRERFTAYSEGRSFANLRLVTAQGTRTKRYSSGSSISRKLSLRCFLGRLVGHRWLASGRTREKTGTHPAGHKWGQAG